MKIMDFAVFLFADFKDSNRKLRFSAMKENIINYLHINSLKWYKYSG